MADVTLESTEEIIQLVSVSGASTADITAAVAVETAARQAADAAHAILTTGIHGVGVSTIASTASVSTAVSTHAALTTGVHGVGASTVDSVSARNAAILAGAPGGATVSDQVLIAWTEGVAYEATAITYNGTYTTLISSATVKWPDTSAGTLTVTAIDTTLLRETAYTITHAASGKTVTQAAVTLNANGDIVTKPALTVA